jgi:ribosomal protein L11 methylase PrmA
VPDPGSPPGRRDPASYRDPAGFVFRRDGVVYRQVDQSFAKDWVAFRETGLRDRLIDAGLLIPHEEVDPMLAAEHPVLAVIRPEPLEFVSYPYEWSFSQLKDAALLTLQAQATAMEAGMSLRDASAYNVQFQRGKPILIDSLSFEVATPGAPWIAYRQFCEHFLAPLALMARVDIRLGELLRQNLEGVPLDLAARLLPRRTRFSFGLGPHIHLHARAQRQHADDAAKPATGVGEAAAATDGAAAPGTLSPSRQKALLESLRNTVASLRWQPSGTEWADYAGHTSYSESATRAKEAAVASALTAAGGSRAWDLGANTGRYSRIAADQGFRVIAFDIDPAAVERGYLAGRERGEERILPLLGDLVDPSPALGWSNAERRSLLERADADVTLSLALVHHLAIGRNVPLPMIADLLARLAPEAIVEFVPKSDAMTTRLLASRRDIFPDYTESGFRAAFATRFDLRTAAPLEGTERTLFHFQRRD